MRKEFERSGGANGSFWNVFDEASGVQNGDENNFDETGDSRSADEMCSGVMDKRAPKMRRQKREQECEEKIHGAGRVRRERYSTRAELARPLHGQPHPHDCASKYEKTLA